MIEQKNYRSLKLILWCLTALAFIEGKAIADPQNLDHIKSPKAPQVGISQGVVKVQTWFFHGKPEDAAHGSNRESKDFVVHPGETFGIGTSYFAKTTKLQLHAELTVPEHQAKKYTCGTCKKGEWKTSDDNSKSIIDSVTSSKNFQSGVWWEVGTHDPIGQYHIELSIDGVQVGAYDFEVRP